ncbi:hypothetical protein L9F63_009258, partial [Diploptera punctata]
PNRSSGIALSARSILIIECLHFSGMIPCVSIITVNISCSNVTKVVYPSLHLYHVRKSSEFKDVLALCSDLRTSFLSSTLVSSRLFVFERFLIVFFCTFSHIIFVWTDSLLLYRIYGYVVRYGNLNHRRGFLNDRMRWSKPVHLKSVHLVLEHAKKFYCTPTIGGKIGRSQDEFTNVAMEKKVMTVNFNCKSYKIILVFDNTNYPSHSRIPCTFIGSSIYFLLLAYT